MISQFGIILIKQENQIFITIFKNMLRYFNDFYFEKHCFVVNYL